MTGLSIGVDIIEVTRIARLVRNRRFLKRVFTDNEVRYCRNHRNSAQHFAVRFAAKEAVWKALNGLKDFHRRGRHAKHCDIQVINSDSGKPDVLLEGALTFWQGQVVISLSHTSSQAVAVAMVKESKS